MVTPRSIIICRIRLLFAVLSLAALVYSLVSLGRYVIADRSELDRSHCLLIEGIVVNKGQSLRQEANMQFPLYLVRYAFDYNGRRIEGLGRVDRDWYHWLKSGEAVDIYVNATNPSKHFLKLEFDYRVGRFRTTAFAAAGACLLLALLAIFRKPAQMLVPRRR